MQQPQVEDLTAKRALLAQLEGPLAPDAVLTTNTSSMSVTVLSTGLAHAQRLVGMRIFNLAEAWGKVLLPARSTPGFVVNRITRPCCPEAPTLLHEQTGTLQVPGVCLRAAGFRMGPCESMDPMGHDNNFAVTNPVFEAHFSTSAIDSVRLNVEQKIDWLAAMGGSVGDRSGCKAHETSALSKTQTDKICSCV